MGPTIKAKTKIDDNQDIAILVGNKPDWKKLPLNSNELKFAKSKFKPGKIIFINQYKRQLFLVCQPSDNNIAKTKEETRICGFDLAVLCSNLEVKELQISSNNSDEAHTLALAEGLALSNYRFDKYKSDPSSINHALSNIGIHTASASKSSIQELYHIVWGNFITRTLVNEPLSYLTAEQLSKEIQVTGKSAGFSVEVFNKKKIESLKMGGLLAVNAGSMNPPTFNILEWKPKNARNKKPIVLVGKGVVYDTGGLSLKPTANSMDKMKSDMGGAGAVVGAFYTLAKNKIPLHVIGLIPATENRPGLNAYAPGDVIKMHSGSTVEVLNTDAEGRMILADALSYARRFKPTLVIDIATLTGAAARAVGPHALVAMGNVDTKMQTLKKSGDETYERVVEFPIWEEYGQMLKSEIADLKNIGGPEAGAITAGKFLQHFTDYPWMHLDIAGKAFKDSRENYRSKSATGIGVRLLYQFLKNWDDNE